VLHEFAPDLTVYYRDGRGRITRRRLPALLPDGFMLRERRARK
jgi:hypothetical protein